MAIISAKQALAGTSRSDNSLCLFTSLGNKALYQFWETPTDAQKKPLQVWVSLKGLRWFLLCKEGWLGRMSNKRL